MPDDSNKVSYTVDFGGIVPSAHNLGMVDLGKIMPTPHLDMISI